MTPEQQLNTALAGRYEVDREIGAGGMATVYLARDVRHSRNVALKVLKPELGAVLGVDRFLAEIQVTANLQHPNLLPLFDSGEASGMLFYVMPFVEGESLRARLDREKQLPVEEAVRIATAIAGALDYAHQHGVIHRDLKPENILLQAGQPVIADFGIALAVSKAGGARVTQTGLSLGTPQYMSPEQATGDRAIDGRTDIYSLAAMTYEMLTGEPPHVGTTAQAIIAKLMTEDVRPLTVLRRSVPPHVDAAVRHGLEKLAADRFATAGDFAQALSGARPVALTGVTAGGATAADAAAARLGRRARTLIVSSSTLAAAGIATSAWLATREPPPPLAAKFEIALPDSVGLFLGGGTKLAISRDGSRLAVVGQRGSARALYLRRVEEPVVQAVNGFDGDPAAAGYSPQFSPDGAWIVFTTTTGLKKVPSAGGTAQTIADTAGTSSWGDRGAVVHTRGTDLWIGSPEGRDARRIARPDTTTGVFRLKWPHVLPGGRFALVTLDRSRMGNVVDSLRLGVVSLEDGAVADLGIAGTNPHYVASGHIVFGRAGGLVFSAPFSLRRRRLTGAAQLLLERVWQGSGGATGFAVADNGTIVYHTDADQRGASLVAVDRTGRERPLPGAQTDFNHPRLAPDGRTIALTHGARSAIWLQDVSTGARQRLTGDEEGFRAEWTRDGRDVLFIRRGAAAGQVVARPADRSGPDRVLVRDTRLFELAPGPARGWMAFRSDGVAGSRDIMIAPMDSPDSIRALVATPADERAPSVSANGRLVAYTSTESGTDEVYVQALPGPSARLQVSVNGGTEPVWARSGSTLFFRGPARVMMAEIAQGPLRVARRDSLFADVYQRDPNHQNWDVFPGARELLMLRSRLGSNAVVALLNWPQLRSLEAGTQRER